MRLANGSTTMKIVLPLAGIVALVAILLFAGCYPTQSEFFRAAREDYTLGSKRPPMDTVVRNYEGPSVPDNLAPTMSIETMTRKASAPANPLYTILARIESTGDYAPMGIRGGENFLYSGVFGTKWIKNSSSLLPLRLKRHKPLDRYAQPPVEPMLLRVTTNSVAFIACLEGCDTGHCSFH
jgi:hypothetical protein